MKTAQLNLSSKIIYRNNIFRNISAVVAKKILQQQESLPLLSFPPSCAFYSVAIKVMIMAPFLQQLSFLRGFNINEDHMPYDLSATVHYKLTKSGNGHYTGHYTAISRSRDLQSQQWFMYDDDRVSSSNFTNKNTMVKKTYEDSYHSVLCQSLN